MWSTTFIETALVKSCWNWAFVIRASELVERLQTKMWGAAMQLQKKMFNWTDFYGMYNKIY